MRSWFPIPSLNTLRSFVFESCCGQTNRQTDRQRDWHKILRTPTDIVGVRKDEEKIAIILNEPCLLDTIQTKLDHVHYLRHIRPARNHSGTAQQVWLVFTYRKCWREATVWTKQNRKSSVMTDEDWSRSYRTGAISTLANSSIVYATDFSSYNTRGSYDHFVDWSLRQVRSLCPVA